MTTTTPARGFLAEHAHYHDDHLFWQRHAERLGGTVLDLGAAAGRVAVPIARAGCDVVAVDRDPEMLDVLMEQARAAGVAHRVTPIVGDMVAVPLPRGVALAIVPMNTLQVLVHAPDRIALFTAVASALRPGGEFVFDLSVPDLDDIRDRLGGVIPTGAHREPGADTVLVHSAVYDALDDAPRTLTFRVIVDRLRGDDVVGHDERTHVVHLYTPDEVHDLVEVAGLEVVTVHAGFDGEPFHPDHSERQVWRCRLPGGVT